MKKPSPGVWRGITCGAMMAVMLGFLVPTVLGESSFDSQYAANQKSITQLQEQIKGLENQTSADASSINKGLYSASEAGRAVAELQTKYQSIDATVTPDDITANAKALSKYFNDESQSGRQPWFTVSKDDAKAVWEFESTYSFQNDKIPVIWLCHIDGSDELVAYATANYDAKSNTFSDVVYKTTRLGANYVDATVSNENAKILDSLIEKIQSQDGGDEGLTESEAQEQNDARDWLKQQAENGGDN
ncbi:hypothetical protein [Alistipes putredinis]|uniref:hypothetical protein n=1 Tax=Alistipes putredinis TaxID=28117 RepID=UPI003AB2BE52